MNKNEIIEIEIEDLNTEGNGVGHVHGLCCFVKGAIPGERVRAKIIKVKKSYAVACIDEILRPSPHRVKPPCRVYKRCGGCTLQHMAYPAQLEWKHNHVKQCFKRIAGLEVPVNFPLPAKEPFRYRNKAAFPVKTENGAPAVGFYRRRSHEVTDVDDCLLQDPSVALLISQLKTWIVHEQVPLYDEQTHTGLLRHVVVRVNDRGEMMLVLVINGEDIPSKKQLLQKLTYLLPKLKTIVLSHNPEKTNVILGKRQTVLTGSGTLAQEILGNTYLIGAHSFLQVNSFGMRALYSSLFSMLKLTKEDRVCDLYCGAGTITLLAAARAGEAIGIEIVPQAIEDAQGNAKRNGVSNVRFICGDAAQEFPKLVREGALSAIIADPPRKGLEPAVIDACVKTGAPKIAYVSCDPATLARDVKLFCERGYTVVAVQPVDLFPQTCHVETVCQLVLRNPVVHVNIDVDVEELVQDKRGQATYGQIKDYVLEHSGLKVSSLYIAQVKQKCGIIERQNYNKPKSEDARQPQCPSEKEAAIMEALKYFQMI